MTNTLIGFLGTEKDARGSLKPRPTLFLCQQKGLQIKTLELLYQPEHYQLAKELAQDVGIEDIDVNLHPLNYDVDKAWDFETVYEQLYAFAQSYKPPSKGQCFVHIGTGTHVAQICLFLLVKTGFISAKLVQAVTRKDTYSIIDINDLSRYKGISALFEDKQKQNENLLKDDIETKNAQYNELIREIESVAVRTTKPIFLTGATGVGKTHLAKRLYELKKAAGKVTGQFFSVNCATLRGDNAMSTLFGHTKGSFTGASTSRNGYLKDADKGVLFLDEIGELGLEEQAMLLHAIESGEFRPYGSDSYIKSDFQLISGTNRDLFEAVKQGTFREDLLARINIWTFKLPDLKDRVEDLEPNIKRELEKYEKNHHVKIRFEAQALQTYLKFATSSQALWTANFRDLLASVTRMATLADDNNKITHDNVTKEIQRLMHSWEQLSTDESNPVKSLHHYLDNPEQYDLFDQMQLVNVISVCKTSKTAAEAGRKLYNVSRLEKKQVNDTKRVSDFLKTFDLKFEDIV
jgi:transcriptional regulatory protein RtcR